MIANTGVQRAKTRRARATLGAGTSRPSSDDGKRDTTLRQIPFTIQHNRRTACDGDVEHSGSESDLTSMSPYLRCRTSGAFADERTVYDTTGNEALGTLNALLRLIDQDRLHCKRLRAQQRVGPCRHQRH